MGIIVGDTLYSSAFKALVDVRNKGVDDARVLDAVEALVEANSELQEGQIMDMLFEERDDVTEDEYMTMVYKKTGALLEASVKLGCIVAGGTSQQLNALKTYGANVGVAFQVKDDILDLTADEAKLGKPVGSDIRSGKKTLIIVHALENADGEDREMILSVLGKQDASDDEIKSVIEKLGQLGSLDYAEAKVRKLIDEGKGALDVLPDTEARNSLWAIAEYLFERRM